MIFKKKKKKITLQNKVIQTEKIRSVHARKTYFSGIIVIQFDSLKLKHFTYDFNKPFARDSYIDDSKKALKYHKEPFIWNSKRY